MEPNAVRAGHTARQERLRKRPTQGSNTQRASSPIRTARSSVTPRLLQEVHSSGDGEELSDLLALASARDLNVALTLATVRSTPRALFALAPKASDASLARAIVLGVKYNEPAALLHPLQEARRRIMDAIRSSDTAAVEKPVLVDGLAAALLNAVRLRSIANVSLLATVLLECSAAQQAKTGEQLSSQGRKLVVMAFELACKHGLYKATEALDKLVRGTVKEEGIQRGYIAACQFGRARMILNLAPSVNERTKFRALKLALSQPAEGTARFLIQHKLGIPKLSVEQQRAAVVDEAHSVSSDDSDDDKDSPAPNAIKKSKGTARGQARPQRIPKNITRLYLLIKAAINGSHRRLVLQLLHYARTQFPGWKRLALLAEQYQGASSISFLKVRQGMEDIASLAKAKGYNSAFNAALECAFIISGGSSQRRVPPPMPPSARTPEKSGHSAVAKDYSHPVQPPPPTPATFSPPKPPSTPAPLSSLHEITHGSPLPPKDKAVNVPSIRMSILHTKKGPAPPAPPTSRRHVSASEVIAKMHR